MKSRKTSEQLKGASQSCGQSTQRFRDGLKDLETLRLEQERLLESMDSGLQKAQSLTEKIRKDSERINQLFED